MILLHIHVHINKMIALNFHGLYFLSMNDNQIVLAYKEIKKKQGRFV